MNCQSQVDGGLSFEIENGVSHIDASKNRMYYIIISYLWFLCFYQFLQTMSSQSSPSCSRSSSLSSFPPPTPNMYQNAIDSDASWIVQKFGGTSVGKFAAKIAEDIVL